MAEVSISEANFQEILPYWRSELWPGRQSLIEETSAINHIGHIDIKLMGQPRFFWKAKFDDDIVGVLSGQLTASDRFRLRGLWVDRVHRSQGIGTELVKIALQKANSLSCRWAWTMPRATTESFYLEKGFQIVCNIEGYEFGPHSIVEMELCDNEPDPIKVTCFINKLFIGFTARFR